MLLRVSSLTTDVKLAVLLKHFKIEENKTRAIMQNLQGILPKEDWDTLQKDYSPVGEMLAFQFATNYSA